MHTIACKRPIASRHLKLSLPPSRQLLHPSVPFRPLPFPDENSFSSRLLNSVTYSPNFSFYFLLSSRHWIIFIGKTSPIIKTFPLSLFHCNFTNFRLSRFVRSWFLAICEPALIRNFFAREIVDVIEIMRNHVKYCSNNCKILFVSFVSSGWWSRLASVASRGQRNCRHEVEIPSLGGRRVVVRRFQDFANPSKERERLEPA